MGCYWPFNSLSEPCRKCHARHYEPSPSYDTPSYSGDGGSSGGAGASGDY